MVTVSVSSITRVSVSSTGAATTAVAYASAVSGDGRFVTFMTAGILAPGDDGSNYNAYLRDMETGTTKLVSMNFNGSPIGIGAGSPSVSDDGRFVTFVSSSPSNVSGDTNGFNDVFVRDMWSGTTALVSSFDGLTLGDANAYATKISGDGRFVTFYSYAKNMVAGTLESDASADVFLKDLLTGAMTKISSTVNGLAGDGNSFMEDISADGRFVAFRSLATNMVGNDTNGVSDIFLRDTILETTIRVSVSTGGAQASGDANAASVSGNGRYVAFGALATNLVAGDTNGASDVFLRDTVAATTTRLSLASDGTQANGNSYLNDISSDGRYVVFHSDASNLVANDTNGVTDVFLRDIVAGTTNRLSIAAGGAQANGASYDGRISSDGTTVIFSSSATNLTPGDSNNATDIFRISLKASNAADFLIGSDKSDTIQGLGGSDIIRGGFGADAMNGGAGNDTMYVDNAGDSIVEGANGGSDTVISSVNFVLTAAAQVEFLKCEGSPDLNLTGNAFSQTIVGGFGKNIIMDGGGAADTLQGLGGDDTYTVRNSSTRVIEVAGGGKDTIFTNTNYTLQSDQDIELLRAQGSLNVILKGNGLANTFFGNAGANELYGGGGNDTFFFTSTSQSTAAASDRIFGFNTGDKLHLREIDADSNAANGDTAFMLDALGVNTFAIGHIRQSASGTSLKLEFNTDADAAAEMVILLDNHATAGIRAADLFA
jgi:Tol biopolymer transport system component